MNDFLAKPTTAQRGGLLVLHAWWGLNDFFRGLCNRFADEGFIALAPDLYNGAIATTIPEAEKLRKGLKRDIASRQILKVLAQLQAEGDDNSLGLIGFSMGANWGLWLVEEKPKAFSATILFYGTRGGEYTKTKSAFLGHFAETDEFVSDLSRKKLEKTLRAAGREVSFHVYPNTGHWFFEKNLPEYNPQAAEIAWERTIAFLKEKLV
jgi:carboxymethylenebutenolidase